MCVFWRESFSVQKMEPSTTMLTGESSDAESIEELNVDGMKQQKNAGRRVFSMTPQKKKVGMTVLRVLLAITFLTGTGIGIWQLYEFAKKNDKKESQPSESDHKDFSEMTVDDKLAFALGQASSKYTNCRGETVLNNIAVVQCDEGEFTYDFKTSITSMTYQDQKSCEQAQLKWGTPDAGNGLGIQLQRCYRP